MDASDRSFHIYGKTHSGKGALSQARGRLSHAERQLLILTDGRRTLGTLAEILGAESLERSLERLVVLGHVELVRHFPDAAEPAAAAAPPEPAPARVEARHPAPRPRLAVPIALAIIIAIGVIAWPLVRPAGRPDAARSAAAGQPDKAPSAAGRAAPGLPAAAPPREAKAGEAPSKPQPVEPRPPAAAPELATAPASGPPSKTPELHVRSQVTPQIPRQLKEQGITSGHVVVVLHVRPDGTVERVELVSATPPQVYDQEMQQAFEQWTFDAPKVHGRMTVQVDVVPPAGTEAGIEAPPRPDPPTDGGKE